jgi:hypothetical protein
MSILVAVALATICFNYQGVKECHPVLLGENNTTPVGEYILSHYSTNAAGYGGDILVFKETKTELWAIHRVWLLNSKQKRLERLQSNNVQDRFISAGCINVSPEVYARLIDCCSKDRLTIK